MAKPPANHKPIRTRSVTRDGAVLRKKLASVEPSTLEMMEAYRRQVTSSASNSTAFLRELGVIDAKGNPLTLCK